MTRSRTVSTPPAPRLCVRLAVVDVHALARLGQHGPQDRLDLGELLRACDQRRRELDHRIAAIVGAADQTAAVQLAGEEAAQERLGLLVVERMPWSSLSLTSSIAWK